MSEIEMRIQARKEGFVQRALQKLLDIRGWMNRQPGTEDEQTALLELTAKHLHQIAGASGIYELTDLSRVAVDAEQHCLLLLAAASGRQRYNELSRWLDEIEQLLRNEVMGTATGNAVIGSSSGQPER
jgi:HPt (histidine-containing phosphotransfer) domain-containing protein